MYTNKLVKMTATQAREYLIRNKKVINMKGFAYSANVSVTALRWFLNSANTDYKNVEKIIGAIEKMQII